MIGRGVPSGLPLDQQLYTYLHTCLHSYSLFTQALVSHCSTPDTCHTTHPVGEHDFHVVHVTFSTITSCHAVCCCGCSLPHWVVPPCCVHPSVTYCTRLCTQGNFFQNLGSIVMFAVCGTAISALIVGGGTYILGLVSQTQAHLLFSRATRGFWHLQCSLCRMWFGCTCIGQHRPPV